MRRREVLRLGMGAAIVGACAACASESSEVSSARGSSTTEPGSAPTDSRRPSSEKTSTTEETRDALTGGFGSIVSAGSVDEVDAALATGGLYVPEARAYVVRYPAEHVEAAKAVYPAELHDSLDAGYLALYQKCPHLGCRVPDCETSGWFECPCHGSMYSPVGEHRGGPSPRGMDVFAVTVDTEVRIDTRAPIEGLGIGVDVTGHEPEGPHCIT